MVGLETRVFVPAASGQQGSVSNPPVLRLATKEGSAAVFPSAKPKKQKKIRKAFGDAIGAGGRLKPGTVEPRADVYVALPPPWCNFVGLKHRDAPIETRDEPVTTHQEEERGDDELIRFLSGSLSYQCPATDRHSPGGSPSSCLLEVKWIVNGERKEGDNEEGGAVVHPEMEMWDKDSTFSLSSGLADPQGIANWLQSLHRQRSTAADAVATHILPQVADWLSRLDPQALVRDYCYIVTKRRVSYKVTKKLKMEETLVRVQPPMSSSGLAGQHCCSPPHYVFDSIAVECKPKHLTKTFTSINHTWSAGGSTVDKCTTAAQGEEGGGGEHSTSSDEGTDEGDNSSDNIEDCTTTTATTTHGDALSFQSVDAWVQGSSGERETSTYTEGREVTTAYWASYPAIVAAVHQRKLLVEKKQKEAPSTASSSSRL